MSPERKLDIEIFNAAMAIDSAEERARYLDETCAGNAERRQRIELLFEACGRADSLFGEEGETFGGRPAGPLGEGPGTKIGSYKLLQQIGEGGMGVVYMAQQEVPVQRKVALKIIKVGMDTRQVVARFEAERQALAMMDHPNIAQVFDAACTESGRPYFVMELVQGVPITEFCDRNKLSTKERLDLFIPVCQAIQSAHQKGIIHRDIKPSNVLVTLHHGEPLAKVIDFGVAKATNQKLTEKTLFTNFGTMVGTPVYMSPEQAEMSSMDVDTRTDVYSLGVLLYELLTGTTPFDQKELLSKGYGEMQRVIAEQEPPKPSLRMSTLSLDKRTAVAKTRGLEAATLQQMLKGDLDCITMKCLEKDRRRRYDTPTELVADLRRHLNNETVSAAPPTFAYQCQKIYRRNKALVHATAAVAVTLIVATIVSVVMAVRMSQLRNEAVQSEKKAVTQAAIAEAINKFLNEDLLKQAEAWNEPDPDIKLRTVVDRADSAIETKFKDQPLVEAAIRLTLCEVYRSLDAQDKAADHSRRARELYERELGKEHPETLKGQVALVRTLLQEANKGKSQLNEACSNASEVFEVCRRVLSEQHETTLAAMRELAKALGNASRYQEQEPLLRQAIALHEKTFGENDTRTLLLFAWLAANRAFSASQFQEAIQLARELVKRSETLSPDHPFRYLAKSKLAAALSWSGDTGRHHAEQRQLAQENLEFARRVFGPRHERTIDALQHRGAAGRDLAEMIQFFTEAHELALDRWGQKHKETLSLQNDLAFALGFGDRKAKVEAEKLYLSGLQLVRTNFSRGENMLREYLLGIGEFYARENLDKADIYFNEAAEISLETLGQQCRDYERALEGLANVYGRRAEWRAQAIDFERKLLNLQKDKYGLRNARTVGTIASLAKNVAEEGDSADADQLIGEAADAFAKSAPQSHEEWSAFRKLLIAIWHSSSKPKFLETLRSSLASASKTIESLTAVAEFHRVADDLKATHRAYQALSNHFPTNHTPWYLHSAAALEAGDVQDHFVCSREMLKRFGNHERGWGPWYQTLKTVFLVPCEWTPEELTVAQRIYDRLNEYDDKKPVPGTVLLSHRAALALADYRLKRFESALQQLNKSTLSDLTYWAWARGQALAVAAMCHAALGQNEKAAEALSASEKAVEKVAYGDLAELVRWRYLFNEAKYALERITPANNGSHGRNSSGVSSLNPGIIFQTRDPR